MPTGSDFARCLMLNTEIMRSLIEELLERYSAESHTA